VTIVRLRRNFGQTAALAAGFTHSGSEYVIAMDGDLQHNPDEIPKFLEKLEEGYDIVSGWRKRRIDNLWLRKIPSRCANWLMAKLSGVDIHDFGTTFKAYRRDLLSQLPLYGEMHRFIPALASRTFRVLFDLITIRFLLRYMSRPLHFFGRLGMMNMSAGFGIALLLLMWKVLFGSGIVQQHGLLLVFAAVLILVGLQLVALGLLGELQVWQYFNPSARTPYALSKVLDVHAAMPAD
jgi:glycosyltransferase involved in cell wall biosynthesis